MLRVKEVDRFDDRLYIQDNLITAYERLMSFVEQHLPDKFFMEGDQRVSLRTKIFREIIANMLAHREYMSAYPASLTIFKDYVETVNASNPHGSGPISPDRFAPFSRNPTISKFFMQLGLVDELGSAILNVNKYLKYYSSGKPEFIEGDVFRVLIPLGDQKGEGTNATVNDLIVHAFGKEINIK